MDKRPSKQLENANKVFNEDIIVERISPVEYVEYEKINVLGTGTFSKVYECINLTTKSKCAIKVVSKNFLLKNDLREQFTKEIKIHFEMNHQNIVKLIKVFENTNFIYLVMELSSKGSLSEMIKKKGTLSESEARIYFRKLLEGIYYIHKKKIVHRDIKPANLVLSDNNQLKIADFGLAAHISSSHKRRKTFCGTPYYIAPEVFDKNAGHSFEIDLWSSGITLYNMLYGKCPFENENIDEVYKSIKESEPEFSNEISKEANDLIKSLLEKNPVKRASIEEALNSNFFAKFKNLNTNLDTAPSFTFLANNKNADDNLQEGKNAIYLKGNSMFTEELKENWFEYVYVKKWINFSDKYGIGALFNNGSICFLFNDKSKIVLSNFGITFTFIPYSKDKSGIVPQIFNIISYPPEIDKKVKILSHFLKELKEKGFLFKIKENMKDEEVYVNTFQNSKYCMLFKLSNNLLQFIFSDGSEVHFFKNQENKSIIFIDSSRNRKIYKGEEEDFGEDLRNRLDRIKKEFTKLIQ